MTLYKIIGYQDMDFIPSGSDESGRIKGRKYHAFKESDRDGFIGLETSTFFIRQAVMDRLKRTGDFIPEPGALVSLSSNGRSVDGFYDMSATKADLDPLVPLCKFCEVD